MTLGDLSFRSIWLSGLLPSLAVFRRVGKRERRERECESVSVCVCVGGLLEGVGGEDYFRYKASSFTCCL